MARKPGQTFPSNASDVPWLGLDVEVEPCTPLASAHAPNDSTDPCSDEPTVQVYRLDPRLPDAAETTFCSNGLALRVAPDTPVTRVMPGQRLWFATGLSVMVPPGYIGMVTPCCGHVCLDSRVMGVEAQLVPAGQQQNLCVLLRNTGFAPCFVVGQMLVAQFTVARLPTSIKFRDTLVQ